MAVQIIWVASYPRSGNTLLRTVLNQCFGLKSASIYSRDLKGNKALESYVGHIKYDDAGKINFPHGAIPFIKTHELPDDDAPAIYIVRDGRPVCVSIWEYYRKLRPLEEIIAGGHRFGTWADHLSAWQPWARPNTLLLKYEDILSDLPSVLENLHNFTGVEIINTNIPDRETMAKVDGRWVKKQSDWREAMGQSQLDIFQEINGRMMRKLGYDLA